MSKYMVWSRVTPEVGEPFDQHELTRTDPKVAENDASLIREVFHRKSWVQEVK
jgi:hypothetical protein